jgi:hypothetical protein
MLGEHAEDVLAEWLGLDRAAARELASRGAFELAEPS